MRTFSSVWAEKEKEGYQYGKEALDQVRFGFALGVLESARERREARLCRTYRQAMLSAVKEIDELEKTLTATQERCTELLNELRAFKQSKALPGLGWDCAQCSAFNGSLKEELTSCRCCDAPRPA